jgi:hypothetical protein
MEATVKYTVEQVEQVMLKHHLVTFPAIDGYHWVSKLTGNYVPTGAEMVLTEDEEKKAEVPQ